MSLTNNNHTTIINSPVSAPIAFRNDQLGTLRMVIDGDGNPWAVLIDVCSILGLGNPSQATSGLDPDEWRMGTLTNSEGSPTNLKRLFVSEPGMYKLIMRSRKPNAAPFQRWVCHDVLPSLRKTGRYFIGTSRDSDELAMALGILAAKRTLAASEQECASLIQQNTKLLNDIEGQREELSLAREENLLLKDKLEGITSANGTITVTEAVRYAARYMPWVKVKDAFSILRKHNMICKNSNAPTRLGIDRGLVVAALTVRNAKDGSRAINPQYAKLTLHGLSWLLDRLHETGEPISNRFGQAPFEAEV